MHRQPRIGKHPSMVEFSLSAAAVKVRISRLRATETTVLQHQRADAATVHSIGDREGDIRRPGSATGSLVGAGADHLAVQQGQQRRVVRPWFAADPAGLPLRRESAQTEKAQVEIVRGHHGMHILHRGEVLGPRRPDLDRGSVGQQRVSAALCVDTHAVPPGILLWPPRRTQSGYATAGTSAAEEDSRTPGCRARPRFAMLSSAFLPGCADPDGQSSRHGCPSRLIGRYSFAGNWCRVRFRWPGRRGGPAGGRYHAVISPLAIQRAMHIHPTVAELVPTILGELQPAFRLNRIILHRKM